MLVCGASNMTTPVGVAVGVAVGAVVGVTVGVAVGGLVGNSNGGSITSCYATAAVIGSDDIGGLVGLDLTVHGPHDGICCPTERKRIHYALQDERLVKVSEPEQKLPNPIEGPVWVWQHTLHVDGTKTTPTEPEHYTLRLGPDGQLEVRADCNRAGGNYRVEGSRLTLSVTHSTMAACPPESLGRQFLADVAAVSAWRLEKSRLSISLTGGGTMVFTPASR